MRRNDTGRRHAAGVQMEMNKNQMRRNDTVRRHAASAQVKIISEGHLCTDDKSELHDVLDTYFKSCNMNDAENHMHRTKHSMHTI